VHAPWPLRAPQVGDLAAAAAGSRVGNDPAPILCALREGAGKVREALLEFRAGDAPAKAGGQGASAQAQQQQGAATAAGDEGLGCQKPEQGGLEVLRLASSMSTSPLSSQVGCMCMCACTLCRPPWLRQGSGHLTDALLVCGSLCCCTEARCTWCGQAGSAGRVQEVLAWSGVNTPML